MSTKMIFLTRVALNSPHIQCRSLNTKLSGPWQSFRAISFSCNQKPYTVNLGPLGGDFCYPCGKTMKIALNRTSRDAIMNAWSANVEDRWQIFIISSHKQTKLAEHWIFRHVFQLCLLPEIVYRKPCVTRTRSQCRCSFVVAAFRTCCALSCRLQPVFSSRVLRNTVIV
jgi:hypothetical protein